MKRLQSLPSGDSCQPGNDPGCWLWFVIGIACFLAIVSTLTGCQSSGHRRDVIEWENAQRASQFFKTHP